MKKILTYALLIILGSCSFFDTNQLPEGILEHDRMVSLMIDVHLIEGAANIHRSKKIFAKEYVSQQYEVVFTKYHLNKESFEANLTYYSAQPEVLEEIYQEVIDSLSKRKSVYQHND